MLFVLPLTITYYSSTISLQAMLFVLPLTVTYYSWQLNGFVVLFTYAFFLLNVILVPRFVRGVASVRERQQRLEGDLRGVHARQRVFREEIVLLKGITYLRAVLRGEVYSFG